MKLRNIAQNASIALGIIIIISYLYQSYQRQQILTYDIPIDHASDNNYIDQYHPKYQIAKYIPYQNQNNYFDYWIYPSFKSHSIINVYLTPKNSTDPNLDTEFTQTKEEILNWIVSKGTVISDIQIDWYLSFPDLNQKKLIEQTNP